MTDGGRPEIAELLIARGAAINAKNRFGSTPLQLAMGWFRPNESVRGKTAVADIISRHGGISADFYGSYILINSKELFPSEVVEKLPQWGGSIDEGVFPSSLRINPDGSFFVVHSWSDKNGHREEEICRGTYSETKNGLVFTPVRFSVPANSSLSAQFRAIFYPSTGLLVLSRDEKSPVSMVFRKVDNTKRHILTIENGTTQIAKIRIKSFIADHGKPEEMDVNPGGTAVCRLPDGRYYEVVRFGSSPESFTYLKGQGFILEAERGYYYTMHLTLQAAPSGNYTSEPATASDFL